MTFIDPTTLAALGVTDVGQFARDNNVTLGAPPPPPVITPTGAGGAPLDAQSGAAIINAFLMQYDLLTPETGAYAQKLATLGLNVSDLTARLAADTIDPNSSLGKAVNTKFPEIQLRRAKAPGEALITVGDVVQARSNVASLMQQAGLPPGFYDQPEDFTNLIVNFGVGSNLTQILTGRINDGYARVANADPAIRQAFTQYFGPDGDAALASYFLDPAKAAPVLDRQVTSAVVGGVGSEFGFSLSRDRAQSIGDSGVTSQQARAGFSNLQHLAPLFNESISEQTDLTPQQEGVDTQFNLGGPGQTELEQRLAQRKAAFSGGGGGPTSTSSGQTGLGSARSR